MSVVFMKGNLSDGFQPYGPYEDYDDAFEAHIVDEGWAMEMEPPQGFNKDSVIDYCHKHPELGAADFDIIV